jgi:hypothetical protein
VRYELGKLRRSDKEFTKEQRLSKENKQLKRELTALRKQVARMDLDQYSTVRDVIDDHDMENKAELTEDFLESLKQQWKCHECPSGFLEIVIFSKLGNPWYFRSCNSCSKRTKSQRYDSTQVKGIVKNGKN